MKEKILISLISLIILVAIGLLFRHGEKVINEDAIWGYSVFHFTSQSDIVDKSGSAAEALAATITNLEGTTTIYKVSFFINDQEIDAVEQKIVAGKTQEVTPGKETSDLFRSIEQNTAFDYLVKVNWNNKKETLTKKIIITDEK